MQTNKPTHQPKPKYISEYKLTNSQSKHTKNQSIINITKHPKHSLQHLKSNKPTNNERKSNKKQPAKRNITK